MTTGKKGYLSTAFGKKRYLVLPLDMLLAALSWHLAWAFRFDSLTPSGWELFPGDGPYLNTILILVASKGLLFVIMGLYRSVWAYASTHDIVLILKTTILSSLVGVVVLFTINRMEGIPRGVPILDGLLLFLLLCFRSFSWRMARDLYYRRLSRHGKRTLLIGAGIAANRLAAELGGNHTYGLLPVGFLDNDSNKIGASIQGLPVYGSTNQLEHFLRALRIDEVIITFKMSSDQMRHVHRVCEERNIGCKTLPPLNEFLSKPEIGASLRDISLEDLLGRDVVRLETEGIKNALHKQTILITGAGGSIGSEVCRQLAQYGPAAMVLLDAAETPLYEIDYELRNQPRNGGAHPRIISVIGDIRDKRQIEQIFKTYDIQDVFHCAAYKHVPMMELNAGQAVLNNIMGTVNLANTARDAGVDRFVMVSTDKAVNPVNIMGATKRIAELYIQNLARVTDTKYITVRFGNVLGSNGSVIPLFKKQIAQGGPITITHPEIIRYFMTIPEAAGLVIQAGVMGQEGEIFILDMGEPVKIKDLAEDMIRFAGLVPHKDIELRYIGLRPGEKLFEELLLDGEGIQPTRHKKIHIARSHNLNLRTITNQIEKLCKAAEAGNRGALYAGIAEMLPEYKPVYGLTYDSNSAAATIDDHDEPEGRQVPPLNEEARPSAGSSGENP